jgi:ribosome-interacting GTPase 1
MKGEKMPAPRVTFTEEQIQRAKELKNDAIRAGALDRNGQDDLIEQIMTETGATRMDLIPIGQEPKFEQIIIDAKNGTITDRNYQPISAEEWVADCKSRNVVPIV